MSLALRMTTVLILNQAAFAGAGAIRSYSSHGYGHKFIFMSLHDLRHRHHEHHEAYSCHIRRRINVALTCPLSLLATALPVKPHLLIRATPDTFCLDASRSSGSTTSRKKEEEGIVLLSDF